MNQLKNGTLFVAIATIVTVILILMTGRDAPHSTPTINETGTKEIVSTQTVSESSEQVAEKAIEKVAEDSTSTVTDDVTQQTIESATESLNVTAPGGPFSKSSADASQKPAGKSASVATTSTQHDLLNHIVQPIWMDQKLGDFKSVGKGEVVFKLMPTSPDGIQGNSPEQVITSKADKFAPTSIPANYNYQQMPMYNGGYYIAPMPSYLMPSMLPGKATTNSDKEANTQN